MKKPLENIIEEFEKAITQLVEMKNEVVQYKNLYEKAVRIFFELVNLNDPKIDKLLAREEIIVTGPKGQIIFPRPEMNRPRVIFDGTKN